VDLHSFALGVSIDRLRIIADVGVSLRMYHGGRLQTVRTWLRVL
jgi:predicted hydrolase (HD superfamily)